MTEKEWGDTVKCMKSGLNKRIKEFRQREGDRTMNIENRQKNEILKRKAEESVVETVHIVRPNHLNGAERLFGGILMQWIDEVAALAAKRHTHRNVITASVDNLSFLKGAYQKDVIVIRGKVTYVGRTSMEVKVDSYVENIDGERILINRAFFTMVALDDSDRPAEVPGLELVTEEEKQEWEKAKLRREMRVRCKEDF